MTKPKAPVVRALDATDVETGFDPAALAASLSPQAPTLGEAPVPTPKAERPSSATFLMAARFGESSRHDLGLTRQESKQFEDDPFMRRLGKMN